MNRKRERSARQAGFTLIELLVVLAVLGLMAIWGLVALRELVNRIKLTGIARECTTFMQKARMDAIKYAVPAEVIYQSAADSDLGVPSLFAFVDINADGAYTAGTDVVSSGPYPLPAGVDLWGPTDNAAEGVNAIAEWDVGATPNPGPIYATDGSVQSEGAFRFREPNGNFLEVRILFVGTAKPVTRKWFGGGNPDSNWYENGDPDHVWQW
jgi:prepilin-type N-terminal cleavage/methylation domain-containing protein